MVTSYKLIKNKTTERKYYKYKGLPWKQPILTANGTMGGNSFAVSASTEFNSNYSAYKAFDNSNTTEWATLGTHNPSWITFYNPRPLKVSLLTLRNRTTYEAFLEGNVYGSNDNSNWDLLTSFINSVTDKDSTWTIDLSNNTSFYKYYKIEGTSFSGTNQGFTNIAITAVEQMPSNIPSTYKCLSSITGGRFNSNIQMTHTTSIECESALVANDTNWQYLIDNDASSGSWFIVGKEQISGPFTCHFLSDFLSLGVSPTVNQFYHFFINMSTTTKQVYIDNNSALSRSDSSTGNLGNTLRFNHSRYKSRYFKIYNSNMELEHYIVPVKRIADDKLGWYDTITDVFYSDSFLEPITAYEELEYEEGTSSDYDFYEDTDVYNYKTIKETAKKYYKYKEMATGYRELEYLTNALFSTGVQCTSQTSFEYEASKINNDNWMYALSNSSSSNSGWFISGYEDGYLKMLYKGSAYSSNINPVIDTYYKIYGDFSTSTKRYYVNDVQRFTISDSSIGNLGGNLQYGMVGWRSKTLKLYDSGLNVIGEFHPCERMSDNTVGWYDVVSNTFITPVVTPTEIGNYIIEDGTAQDYDFYEDIDIYKVVQEVGSEPVEQIMSIPQMNSNSQDGFTVVANHYDRQWGSYEYTLFSPVSSGWFAGSNTSKPDTISITFPESHYISKIILKQNNNANSIAHNGRVEITTDGSNYTTLTNFTMDTTLESLTTVDLNVNCLGYRLVFTDNASTQYPNNGVCILSVTTYELV